MDVALKIILKIAHKPASWHAFSESRVVFFFSLIDSARFGDCDIIMVIFFFRWYYDINQVSAVYYSRTVIYPTWSEFEQLASLHLYSITFEMQIATSMYLLAKSRVNVL